MSVSKESRDKAFSQGQKYASGKGPTIDLPGPSVKVFESSSDYNTRDKAWRDGAKSVRNNKK